jgi:hypothetical protein
MLPATPKKFGLDPLVFRRVCAIRSLGVVIVVVMLARAR